MENMFSWKKKKKSVKGPIEPISFVTIKKQQNNWKIIL